LLCYWVEVAVKRKPIYLCLLNRINDVFKF
jgi:hypothetical protein